MSSFTPGPWRIHENAVSIDIVDVAHSHGLAIIEKVGVNDEQKMANARLMATAPELLEFIKQYAGECYEEDGEFPAEGESGKAPCVACQANALIAKAESSQLAA